MAKSSRDQIRRLRAEYERDPGSRVFVHLAEAYRQAGDLPQAHEVLAQGLRRNPDYPSGLVVLARVLADQGDDGRAEQVWRDVLRLDGENIIALRALGDLAEASGRRDEAMQYYRHVVRLENAGPDEGVEAGYAVGVMDDSPRDAAGDDFGAAGPATFADAGEPGRAETFPAAAEPEVVRVAAVEPAPSASANGHGHADVVEEEEETKAEEPASTLDAGAPAADAAGAVSGDAAKPAAARADDGFRESVERALAEALKSRRAPPSGEDADAAPSIPTPRFSTADIPEAPAPAAALEEEEEPAAWEDGEEPAALEAEEPPALAGGEEELDEEIADDEENPDAAEIFGAGDAAELAADLEERGEPEPEEEPAAAYGAVDEPDGSFYSEEEAPAAFYAGDEGWVDAEVVEDEEPDLAPAASSGRGRAWADEARAAFLAQPATAAGSGADAAPAAPGAGSALPLAGLLVRLMEQEGPRFQAQSSLRRLLAMAIGRELGLDARQLDALALAALLGGLGEVAFPGGGGAPGPDGRRLALVLQLLAEVPLPEGTREAVAHQYERWDGTGLPSGLREDGIPFTARILGVARAAAELLAGAAPEPGAVVDELQRQAGAAFDPVVVSVLRRVFAQRERHGIGYGWGGRVAVAHTRELRALDLAARLHDAGYAAETAPSAAALRERLVGGPPRALVLGADLPDADLVALVREVRGAAALAGLPIVVVDAPSPAARVALLTAGADVCFPPEAGYEEVSATLDAFLRRNETVAPRQV